MELKINNVVIAKYPIKFTVTVLDLDDSEASVRTLDGTLNRNRIAVKRQIEMEFSALKWSEISSILQAMQSEFFDFYYPDPMIGTYVTYKMYVGNRPAPVAIEKNGELWWEGLNVTLTEK